ncbi:type IV secretion system oncogenic effector CagA, partial [Helicobacter pylori]
EPIYAQVAKKVNAKIDQLNQAVSEAKDGLKNEPIYAKVNKKKAGQAASHEEPIYAQVAKKVNAKIDQLNQAVSEAKAGFFGNLEQTIDKLKDSAKNNPVNLWAESAKKVPASLSAKLGNYATNNHTRINSNIRNGAINEKATGMLTQKNPEWLKLVNDKIVAHNVGSVPLSEYDKIGFNQKNMKDYSDSFKFSTKLNNAAKDIKSGFTQFLANAFSTGYYCLAGENAEHGIKNVNTKGGFQKS